MGIIHTRSERDACDAEATVWEVVTRAMERKLPQIPEVKILIEVCRDESFDARKRADQAHQRLAAEVISAKSGLRY